MRFVRLGSRRTDQCSRSVSPGGRAASIVVLKALVETGRVGRAHRPRARSLFELRHGDGLGTTTLGGSGAVGTGKPGGYLSAVRLAFFEGWALPAFYLAIVQPFDRPP